MRPPPAGADSLTVRVYLQGQVELASAYYRAKDYAAIDPLVDPLLAGLGKDGLKLEDKPKEDARASLVLLKLSGRRGAAEAEFNAGHPDKVKAIIDPIVEAIRKGDYPELKKDPALRWLLMDLALRVSIQEGNMARARDILQSVQALAGDDAGDGAKAILMRLAVMVKDQVREARKKKDEKLLATTVDNFGSFLTELEKGQKAPTPEFLRVLAEAYAALGKHDKAVELARQVAEPKGGEEKELKKQQSNYHFCQFLIVRELRLAGKVDEANAELTRIKGTPWGKDHPEATKETIQLLAVKAPGPAYGQWSALVSKLGQRMQDPGVKDQYFECYYYMTECMTRYALAQTGAKRDEYLKRAAGQITKLEAAWPDLGGDEAKARFTDLLEREPLLKEQYDKAKGDKK
jgi:hypothetical protein